MTTFLLSNAKVFLPSLLPSTSSPSSSSSSSSSSPSTLHTQPQQIVCRSAPTDHPSTIVTTRRNISLSLSAAVATILSAANYNAGAAILEADEDDELMEKVKRDRKKRLDKLKLGVISSSTKEKAYLQDLVFKLSRIGESIEKNDLSVANSVSKDTDWLQKVNTALNKLSTSEEEKTEVDIINLSLSSLISSISQNDVEASKKAFVASASAFEKWTMLSGLSEQLKGL